MASQEDVSQMASLLLALTQPNTETIRQAEVALKPILKDPRSVPALFEIIKGRGVHADSVRHVASILLRKRVASHYSKFESPQQVEFRKELLQVLASETERPVRGGVVGIVAQLAKQESTSWEELWQFVAAAAGDANGQARELAFWLLQETTETVGLHLQAQYNNMRDTLFAKGLQDAEAPVQKAAVKALGQLMSFLASEPDVQIFLGQLPLMLQVSVARLQQDEDEETVATVLDVLYDLAYSPSIGPDQLKDMVQFSLLCLQNTNMDVTTRDSAALVIATLAEAKPKTFGKDEALVAGVLEALFALIENSPESAAGALLESNPAWREDEDEDDDDDYKDTPTETSMAQGTLDMLACELPKKYIFTPSMTRCMSRLANTQSPAARKAGIACLGVIAEGCSEPMREHLPDLMPHVLKAAGDGDAQVRECACFALGQISEHCQPEILGYSSQILPIVFQLLDDSTMSVQATSCYVLEMFCERLEPDAVRPLLDSLVRKLAGMLEVSTKRAVQEMAVAALAATAVAAEAEFTPYIAGTATLMNKLMALQEERLYSLRGRALECMGHMAIAVGKQAFRPYFTATMQCACEGLATESTDLHEFAYAVFANLAKVMGEEFAPVLPELVPHLVKVIGANEGTMEKAAEENNQFNSLDDSDDEDDENGGYVLHVRTALLEAKKGAITAIGEMAAHTGSAFVPYLEQVMEVLSEAGRTHWHPLIKCEVGEALPSMVVPSVAAYHGGEVTWEKGDANPESNPLNQHTAAITTAVLAELMELMNDEDKETVGKACEGVQSVIELVGPHALSGIATEVLKLTHDLLMRKAPCQQVDDAYEAVAGSGEVEDDDDHETMMTAVCDLVGGLSRVMGPHFNQYLNEFLPGILSYAKSSRPVSDRSMAMGCVSEVAQEIDVSDYWESQYKPAILQGLADPDDNVKRNAAFGCGVCSEKLGEKLVADYPLLLQALSPLFSIQNMNNESSAACRDNAVAALSRMIMALPSHVPLAQVLPPLLQALPLQTDMTENETVYTCLLGLLQMNQPELLANSEHLKRVFLEATAETSKVAPEIQEKLKLAAESMGWA
eukprot:CAMPEP_0194200314 /NCGR_PEP_ID=MMETSP0156-20130528/969_1 /TAXON_ID=33649 /ORGANISM="Thalassionema nitzschioides, Strain L26-B" /LENGTH=1071 /DNA_ID=CAMNT_0038925291 /DNA_START=70 /DNA_END=3285 /DNA_ORIENTATION=-